MSVSFWVHARRVFFDGLHGIPLFVFGAKSGDDSPWGDRLIAALF